MTLAKHAPGGLRLAEVRASPQNYETPLRAMETRTTPNSLFYIRTHFPPPAVESLKDWRLSIEGEVDHPVNFTYGELSRLPKSTFCAVLECAGNSRSRFESTPPSELRWGDGAVSNARWSGVSLGKLLSRAGPRRGSTHVVFVGADQGSVRGARTPTPFARGLPLSQALDPDIIVALKMNGVGLPPEHGFPARLIVPRWYAMASVKWLRRVIVSKQPFEGYFNSVKYVYVRGTNSRPEKEPVTLMNVKSLITSPLDGERLGLGPLTVRGVAWSGHGRVVRVELKIGKAVVEAKVLTQTGRYGWSPWKAEWNPDSAGKLVISARATDEKHNTQPAAQLANRYQYGCNAPHTVSVTLT